MKKRDLASLAMLGISAGLIAGGCQHFQKKTENDMDKADGVAKDAEHMSGDMKAFYGTLSDESKKKFMELDAQHKMMAMQMANQSCNGKNACAGMGGCASDSNSCAGENSCKGKGGAPVKDPNKAIQVQYKHQMAEQKKMDS